MGIAGETSTQGLTADFSKAQSISASSRLAPSEVAAKRDLPPEDSFDEDTSTDGMSSTSADEDEETPEKRFMRKCLVNIDRDERHLSLGMSVMSKLFLRYGTDEERLERLFQRYPTAAAKFLSKVFKTALDKEDKESSPSEKTKSSSICLKRAGGDDTSNTEITPLKRRRDIEILNADPLRNDLSKQSPSEFFLIDEIEKDRQRTMQQIVDENPQLAKRIAEERSSDDNKRGPPMEKSA